MRRPLLAAVCLLALAACASPAPEETPTQAASTPAVPAPSAPSATPPDGASVPTDVSGDVLIPGNAWELEGPGAPEPGVVGWRLPEACAPGAPQSAVAMVTSVHGDGAEEAQVGAQQVAVFADADAAVAEADRLAGVLDQCSGPAAEGATTTYAVEPLAVGAQGRGLAVDHYGASAGGPVEDGALGAYVAVTRRGSAITLVGLEGGESTVGDARTTVSALAQEAWGLLCRYEVAGCA